MKTPARIFLLALLIFSIPACQQLEQWMNLNQDPEVAQAAVQISELTDDLTETADRITELRDRLETDGLTTENAVAVVAEFDQATKDYERIRGEIEAVEEILAEKQDQSGAPWWVVILGLLTTAASPTMNGIPLVGRLMGNKYVAMGLEKVGLRDETQRATARTAPPTGGSTPT